MEIVPFLLLLCGGVTAALCVPLMQGKVGPNKIYGIRTRAAFSSEENWYRLQKSGGRIFVISSSIIAVVGALGFLVPAADLPIYAIIAAIITLGSIIGAGVLVLLIS